MRTPQQYHGHAHCHRCDWRYDEFGEPKKFDLAARKHQEAEASHGTTTNMHRLDVCQTLGCPPAPEQQ